MSNKSSNWHHNQNGNFQVKKLSSNVYILTNINFSEWFPSGAANDHVTAFFQDRPIFVFSENLGYSLLKNFRYPNLWSCGGIWSNSIMLSFMGKYSSCGLVFSPVTNIFWTACGNYLKFGIKIATTIKVRQKFKRSMFQLPWLLDDVIPKCQNCEK